MKNCLLALLFAAGAAFAQYKIEPLAAPPSGLAPAFASQLAPQGVKVLAPDGSEYCELWLRNSTPSGQKQDDPAISLPTLPQGALLGVIVFPKNAADRRGQTLKPGLYTLRYSDYPSNGDHQGVAPQREFALLTPAAIDTDPNALPDFDHLVDMSRKASGTPHPAVLSIYPSSNTTFPAITKEGDQDWVVHMKLGSQPLAIIVAGKYEG